MILDLVRSKAGVVRPQRFLKFLLPFFVGFLVSIIGQGSMPQDANALYFGSGYLAPYAGGGGGNQNGAAVCPLDMVAVGVGFTVNGNTPGFGVYCRAIGPDGQLVAQDQSSISNTSAVGSGNTRVFCEPGKVVTGFSFRSWSNVRIRCATPPSLNDNAQTAWALAATGTEIFSNCNAGGIVAGFYTRTGAWTDAIGAYCLPYLLNTLSYNLNGGSGVAPANQTQTAPAQNLTVSSTYTGTRTRFTFAGWNTLANGLGTDYANGSTIRPVGATTLYAKWTSVISYDGNTNDSGSVPTSTTAISSAAVTNLAHNSGSLVKSGFTFSGWNTAANGSGTNYPASNPALVSETPYMHFDATNFDDTTNAWTDGSGNSRSIPGTAVTNATTGFIRGNPSKVTNSAGANGSSKSFPAVQGTTADGIVIGNGALTNYTFCHVARYAGATRTRIFAGTTGNWLSGFWGSATGVAYHEGWITPSTGTNDTNWKVQCDTGGSSSLLRSNGVLKSSISNNATGLPANISINLQGSRFAPSETSDWAVAEFLIYDSVLSTTKIQEIEERLNRKYGVGLFTPSIHTYTYASTGDITLYAQWNSTITYNGNGNTGGTVPTSTIAKGTAANTTLANAGTMVRTGYTFVGWNTAADGTGTDYASGLTTYQSSGSTTLYAKWRRTITYSSNGAASGAPERTTDVFINATTPTISTFPTVGTMVRTGYTFAGWSTTTTGTALTTPYATTGEVTLYARWTANTYTVTYDTSTVTSGTMASTSLTAGTAFALRANTFVKSGYSFKNWNTASNGSGTTYTNSQSITLYGDITLYPQWTPLVPGTPTLTATAGNTEFTISPVAPAASTSVGTATSYTVEAMTTSNISLNPAKTCIITVPATSCTITGLTNGIIYRFRALATNSAGSSAYGWVSPTSGPAGSIVTYNATSNSGTMTSLSVTGKSLSSNVATLTTSAAHGFTVGMSVVIASVDSTFNGTYFITAVPSTTTFSYIKTSTNVTQASVSPAGTATLAGTDTFNKGTPLVLPRASRANYTFAGWYTSASGGTLVGDAGTSYSPTSAVTLYAQFSGIKYLISYNGNGNTGGTVPTNGSFETGGSSYVILGGTNPPSKVGYTFDGWYTNSTGTGGTAVSVGSSYSSTANLNLFAKWSPASRTVTYALDSGTSSANTSQLTGKVVGDTITLPAANTMSKTGYVFGGWSDGTATYAGGATWTVPASDNNFTLTAQWTTQTLSYSYDTNGGGTAPAGGTKTYGETLVLSDAAGLSKTGYTFAGWNDGSTTQNASASVTMTTNKVYVAQWTAQSYSITYNGNSPTSGNVDSGSYVAGGVPYAIAANGFTKTGYTFAGWKDASNNSYAVGAGYSTAANLVLTAQWTASSFTVSYNANGATGGTAPADGAYTTAVAFSVSANSGSLVKSGYTFAGWNTSAAGTGTTYAENGPLTTTSNLTLYAKWTIISPSILFNQGAATTTPAVFPTNTSAQYGSLYTLPATDTSTVISDVTQIFTGWSDGTNTYAVGDTYRMGTANVTFTAQWVAVYTVRYVLNGGSGSVPADVLRTNNFTETLTSATVTKTGFTLTGWKDQSGVTIASGANNWVITGSSYVAYAQWSPTPRTLSFGLNGGSGSEASITDKVIGELVTLPTPTSTKTGYTFGGWSAGGTTYPAGATFTVGDGNTAFTAVWIGNLNTITYNANGATGGTTPANGSHVSGGSAYTVSANSGNLVKTGFEFAGWYTTASGSGGTSYADSGSATLTTLSDVILYAKWTAASFAVTYSTDGGSTAPTQSDTMYGATFTLPTAPTKSGSNFLGWETASNIYAPGSTFTMPASTVSFIARWSQITYAITYALNGGAGATPTQANVASGGSFTTAAAPTKSGFTFTGWSDGATSTNAATSISNVTSNITLTAQWTIAAPGVPGTPTAAPGNGSATITISAPSTGGTPSSYTVTASPGGATCTVTAPGTSCTVSPLTNGTAYTFTSTATNSAGTSTSASSASSSVTPAGVPTSPTGVTGTGTGGSANISWTAPSSDGGSAITDYVIEYSVDGSGTWTTFADGTTTATSATVTGLVAGNAYEFRVSAKNLIGSSLPSFASPTIETLPTAPAITGTTPASEQVTVTWTAPTHMGSGTISQYTITAYDSNGNVAGSCNPNPGQLSCVVSGLDNGSAYTFKALATTSIGDSIQSSATSSVTPAGVPSAPSGVSAVTSGSNMIITFTAPSDNGGAAITSYVVTSDPAGATCTVGANATTYVCTGLTAGTNYTYTVKAVNNRGESSASLASTAVTAVARPSAPQNVSAVITAGTTTLSATVSFDAPATDNGSPVTSYTVTAAPGGATCTVTAPTTYCDIPVLPDRVYTFSVTATNAVGTSIASASSLEIKATNGIAPTLVTDPIPAPTGDLMESKVLSSNVDVSSFNSTPNSVITYQWKRCTDPLDENSCSNISGATSSTYALTSTDVDDYIRVEVTATNSIGSITKLSEVTEVILAAPTVPSTPTAPTTPTTPTTPVSDPAPVAPTCNAACQAIKDAAATKAAADAAAKAAADKAAADAAAKLKADAAAATASTKAAADAAAAAVAAKVAVEKAAAAEAAKIAAETAAAAATAKAKAAADAQAAANKAAATAAAALKSSAASAAAKAAATASAQKAAADAAAAVKAAASAAQQAATAKNSAANANKQVEIAINSLSSKTATSKASAQADAIAAAAKTAANEAAAAAAAKASEAKATATAAQKAAADTAARIAIEQKEAATAAAAAKAAADAAAKATAEKIAATNAAKTASENLLKVLEEKATLAEQAAKTSDENVRAEIAKKLEEIEVKAVEAQKIAEEATAEADDAVAEYEEAIDQATEASEVAETQAAEAFAVKAESVTKTAVATKAAAAATVAAKVATAAKAAAAKVPSKAVITKKPSTTSKNSATASVTGLKPGQKVKVTVNVKPKP